MTAPLLFIIFNRPAVTRKVFSAIRDSRPEKLYIAADGPRNSRPSDSQLCEETRSIVKQVDWPCQVITRFQDENLGCKAGVSSSISWFFEHEESGIILEDDCLPSRSFFEYCEELLSKYKEDPRVWHICGDNFQKGITRGSSDYYFSNHIHVWGWATWRNRWRAYDVVLENFTPVKAHNVLKKIYQQKFHIEYWLKILTAVHAGKIDTWDYQWMYTIWKNEGMAAVPNKNLVSNLGFDSAATHTTKMDTNLSQLPCGELDFPLRHPELIVRDIAADEWLNLQLFKRLSVVERIGARFKKFMNSDD